MFRHEAYAWMEEVTSSNSWAFDESGHREFEKVVLLPVESSQISHAYVQSILWFGRLITSTPYVSLAHQATDRFVQGE